MSEAKRKASGGRGAPLASRWRAACVASLAVTSACGGASARPSPPIVPHEPPVVWDRMTEPQKEDYMRSTVMPEMREVFARFDPHRYANMGCAPCHARGRRDGSYRMPNEELLLDPTKCSEDPGGDPKMVVMYRFMNEEVGPAIARLLGKPWNSCYICHDHDE